MRLGPLLSRVYITALDRTRRDDLVPEFHLSRLAVDVGGANPVQFNGSGVYARTGENHSLTLRGGGRVRDVAFTTRNPAVLALAGEFVPDAVNVQVGGVVGEEVRPWLSLVQKLGIVLSAVAGRLPSSVTVSLFTCTRPAVMSSSACRREATPARARYF